MMRETGKAIGFEISISDYRQLQVGWDRKYVRPGLKDEDEDGDDEEEDDLEDFSDLQAAHSGHTARNHYGLTGAMLSAEGMKQFQRTSALWHHWIGQTSRPPRSMFQPTASLPASPPPPEDRTAALNRALVKLYGNPEPRWSCDEQRESVNAILDGESPLVCILPTGGGKSALIMIPALMDPGRTNIVFTAYVALADDFVRQCKEVGIHCIRWKRKQTGIARASIVVVVLETGITAEFITYARDLASQGLLARTYVDEAQVLIHDLLFRPLLQKYRNISLSVQTVHLTATFPPTMARSYEIEQLLTDPSPTYIRASTNRSNARYHVVRQPAKDFQRAVAQIISDRLQDLKPGEKILVFCKSYESVREVAAVVSSAFTYFGKDEHNTANLRSWIEGERPIMIATTGLGAGVNIKGIKLVLHVDLT
jgi:superfamily II DNA helicase RecQ